MIISRLSEKIKSLSQLKLNTIANYAGQFWSRGLSFFLVPVYLHYLGVESYGLIGAFYAITSFVSLLDLGLGTTVMREVSQRLAVSEKQKSIPDLLRTIEIIYWTIGLGLMLFMLLIANPVSTHWLNPENLDAKTVKIAVLILGTTLAIRWPTTPYTGTLMALEKQVQLNFLQVFIKSLQGLGSVVILIWISPSIIAFLLWQTVLSLVEIFLLFKLAWHYLPNTKDSPHFRLEILHQVWRFAAGMSATTLVTLMLTQSDKILLSNLLSLKNFGYYMIAHTLASQLMVFYSPFLNAFSPRLMASVAKGDEQELARLFHKGSLFVSVLVTPAAAVLIVFAPVILELWTQSEETAIQAAGPLSLLAFGTLMNSMMHVPYQLQLAIGKPQIAAIINACAVVLLIPTMFIGVQIFGMVGAAFVWAILNTAYYIGTSRVTHWYVLKKSYTRWLLNDTLIPIISSFTVAFLFWFIYINFKMESFAWSFLLSSCALFFSYLLAAVWYIQQRKESRFLKASS